MNRYVKIVCCCWMFSASCAAEQAACDQVWLPGMRYQTQIRYTFRFTDAILNLENSAEKPYRAEGHFEVPRLEFFPIVKYVTEDVRQNGNNFYAVRRYEIPTIHFVGGENIKWKRTVKNWKMLWRWHWFNVWRDNDLNRLNEFMKKSESDGTVVETFPMFDLGYDNAVFDADSDALFFRWTDRSLSDFLKTGDGQLEVEIGDRDDSPLDGKIRGKADRAIHDVIRSEWNLSASVLFDSSGNGAIRQLRKNREWEIDAAKLNAFLAHEKLREAVHFSGLISATCKRIAPEAVKEKYGRVFDAVCIQAKASRGFKLGFDTGKGRNESFDVGFGREGANEGRLELWFDQENELLRYARLTIEKDGYKGVIPNPGLGAMISQLGGKIQGKLFFDLEYVTEVAPSQNRLARKPSNGLQTNPMRKGEREK